MRSFDVFEPVVIGVEHFLRVLEIERVFRARCSTAVRRSARDSCARPDSRRRSRTCAPRRFSSRSTSFCTASGRFALASCSRSSAVSSLPPPSSPNACSMARFCCRNRCSRCCLSMSCFAVSAISRRTSFTFFSCSRMSWIFLHQRERRRRREHFLLFLDVEVRERRDAVHLHDRVGDRTDELMENLQAVLGVEHLRDGAREFEVFDGRARRRADASGSCSSTCRFGSGRNVHFEMVSLLCSASTPHALDTLHDDVGAAVAALDALDRRRACRCRGFRRDRARPARRRAAPPSAAADCAPTAALTAARDFGLPTASGTTSSGNTTVFFSGRTGSVRTVSVM